MRCASTWMPEKWTQTPSPSPDLFPAPTLTRNSHSDWHCEWGHFNWLKVAFGPLAYIADRVLIEAPEVAHRNSAFRLGLHSRKR